jgi:hypothetical protein
MSRHVPEFSYQLNDRKDLAGMGLTETFRLSSRWEVVMVVKAEQTYEGVVCSEKIASKTQQTMLFCCAITSLACKR